MAERNKVGSAFCRHNSSDLRNAKHGALFQLSLLTRYLFHNGLDSMSRHCHPSPGDCRALGNQFITNINHAGPTLFVEMGETQDPLAMMETSTLLEVFEAADIALILTDAIPEESALYSIKIR